MRKDIRITTGIEEPNTTKNVQGIASNIASGPKLIGNIPTTKRVIEQLNQLRKKPRPTTNKGKTRSRNQQDQIPVEPQLK